MKPGRLKLINDKAEKYKNTDIKQNQDDLLIPGIYLYLFPGGKKYVGQTITTIIYRTMQHIKDARLASRTGCPILDNKTRKLITIINNGIFPADVESCEEIFFNNVKIFVLEIIEQGGLTDEVYWKLLNDRELYFIKEHKCYGSSKNYDGSMGLNCNPGEGGTEMRKRNEDNCYNHHGEPLYNGIQSLKIREKIVGYKSRKRGKYNHTINIGNSYDFSLDKKLKIAIEFKKLKINSVALEEKKVIDFKKKYNLNNTKRSGTTKSSEKQDHEGNKLLSGIFYNKEKKEYRINIKRQGVFTRIALGQEGCNSLDEQKKEAISLYEKISTMPLDSDDIINKTHGALRGHIKLNKLPIFIGLDSSRYKLLCKIKKYQNPENRQEVIDEYNRLKEWHDAPPPYPDGWKQMWGGICDREKNKGWTDTGCFTYKNPENIIFGFKKVAKKYIGVPLPDFNKIIKELPEGLSSNERQTQISKHLWKSTKGWNLYISDAIWNYNYEIYIAFLKEKGRHPINHEQKYKGISPGSWMADQKTYYKKGTLLEGRIKKLEALPDWYWDDKDKWNKIYDKLKIYMKTHNKIPGCKRGGRKNEDLGKWCGSQRTNKHKFSEEQIKKLEAIPGWYWTREDLWDIKCNLVVGYEKTEKKIPQNNVIFKEYNIGNWCDSQRQCKKNNKLSKERIKKLEIITGWYWTIEDSWDIQCNLVIEYEKNEKKIPARGSRGGVIFKEYNIGNWCDSQRQCKKNNKLSKERIKKLEAIPGWYWTRDWDDKDKWNKIYDKLKIYMKTHNKIPGRKRGGRKNEDLGNWCGPQRTNKHKLSEEQIKKLEAIPGWYWTREDLWDIKYNLVVEYEKMEKKIPQTTVIFKKYNIGNWCDSQRQCKKNNKLSKERIKKLEAITGWHWVFNIKC